MKQFRTKGWEGTGHLSGLKFIQGKHNGDEALAVFEVVVLICCVCVSVWCVT